MGLAQPKLEMVMATRIREEEAMKMELRKKREELEGRLENTMEKVIAYYKTMN